MPPDSCPKCLKPKHEQTAGSITQWLNSCRCAPVDQVNHAEQTIEKVRCAACGKSISEAKSGSLTQWIFKEDTCCCERPDPLESSPEYFKKPAFVGFEESDHESELSVEDEKFPLDRYKPISVLGRGESGAVYLSRDRLLGKKVAVKVLRKLEREALLSFQNEAKTTSKLTHPNIIRILDFGCTVGGTPYMVMDYVKGSTLEDYLKVNETLDLQRCLTIFTDIADALAYAHDADILHRDIKPSNIMVSHENEGLHASLIDFGVAKMQAHFEDTTRINGTALVGTPAYMSPDQASGREFDQRSDIYSLGCVLFECLTGKPPYLADSPLEIISLHAHGDIPSLFDMYPKTSTVAYLDQMIRKCLDKDPNRRYGDVSEFRMALEDIPALKKWRSEAKPAHVMPEQTQRPRRPGPLALIVLGCSCILVSSVASLAWYMLSATDPLDETKIEAANNHQNGIVSLENGHLDVTSGNDRDLREVRYYPSAIESVHFMDCKITAQGIKYIQKKKVRALSVDMGSEISPSLLKGISKLKDLGRLHLASAKPIDPEALALLANIPELEDLFLKGLIINKETFRAIGKMSRLQNLKLQDCDGIDREGLQQLKGLPSLSTIELSMGHISTSIIDGICDLPQLKSLDLSGTDVSDKDLVKLENCRNLQHLSLLFCPNITDPAVKSFSKRTKVDVFSNSYETKKVWWEDSHRNLDWPEF